MPKISVVLTAHPGYDKYLERAIKSVVEQTFKDWELVIAYDEKKLTTEAQEVINKFSDHADKIVVLPAKKFGNHTRPKNTGTKAAKGEFIAYLDADNAYRKDHLAALYREILRSGADCVYGDRMIVAQEEPKKRAPGISSEFSLSLLGQQNFIDTSDVLVKREVVLAVGGWDEELEYFADWNLWVRMAKAGYGFKHVPLTLTDYYWHGENNVLKSHKAKQVNFDVQGCPIWPDKTSMGERPKLKVAIFMLTYNRLPYTIETITTMYEKAGYEFDLYIIDQASTDKTQIWLADNEKKYGYKYKRLEENVGISKGSNMALDWIAEKEYDVIGKVDNDMSFQTDDWLKDMVDVYNRNRMAILSPYVEGLIDHPGGSPRYRNGYIGHHYVGLVEHLGGCSCFAPVSAYKDFRWKDNDFLHGMQDSIFSRTMLESGYVLMYLENIRVEHMFPTSTNYVDKENEKPEDKEYREKRRQEKVTRYEP